MNDKKNYWAGIASVIVFLALWEASGRFEWIDPIFTSVPSVIFNEGWKLIKSGAVWPHFAASISVFFVGFLVAIAAGIAGGLAAGFFRRAYDIFRPFIFGINALPMIAVVPLVMIWFGIGPLSKIAIVFLMSFKPILVNAIDGARSSEKNLLEMARSFGAERFFTLRTIVFPSALPFIFSGIRLAVGRGIVGLVIAEAFGYGRGLGYLASYYGINFQTPRLMFIILVLLLINLILVETISAIEKRASYV